MIKVAVCRACKQVADFTLIGVENGVTLWKCAFCGTTRKGSDFLHPTQEQEAVAHWQKQRSI